MSVENAPNTETANAYEIVMDAIVTQKLVPGQKVSELIFADLFEISRAVARNLIERLAAQQFLVSSSPRVTLVAPLTLLEVKQNFKLRKILLPEAAALAAEDIDYKKIEALDDELKSLLPVNNDETALRILKINKQQNMELIAPTGYPIMMEWVRQLENTAMRIYWLYLKIENNLPYPIEQQTNIFEILSSNKPNKAKSLIEDIIDQSEKKILDTIFSKDQLYTQNLLVSKLRHGSIL